MFNKINVSKIVQDHFSTFKSAKRNGLDFTELFIYFSLPLVAAYLLIFYFNVVLSDTLLSVLITALSILMGLLLNLLVILFDITGKINEKDPKRELRKQLLKETYSNVSFGILISLVGVGFLVLSYSNHDYIRVPANAISVLLLGMFLYTLLMILKRTHALLSSQFEQ